tara:strand:- start:572 stop:1009 length:438 start_codon:yes stop_codon:yes gene_type:complete
MISNKRQAKYMATEKGKIAHRKANKASADKKRKTKKGREDLKKINIRCEWGNEIAEWWDKKLPICDGCGDVFKEKAPQRKNKNTPNFNKELCIDHDHKNDKKDFKKTPGLLPRGLLCNRCNLTLGFNKDNIERLKKLIKYLKNNK